MPYIHVQSGKVETFKRSKLASSNCLTKFLVGRGLSDRKNDGCVH